MRTTPFLAAIACFIGLSAPVFAHHGMDGRVPATFIEGLISGVLHPVLGADHFLGIVAVALLTLGIPRGHWLAVAFVATSVIGTALHLANVDVPAAEALIAGTLVLFGALVLALRSPAHRVWLGYLLPVMLAAGTLHGYAYGEAIVGAGSSPLTAYLVGFCAVQTAVILGVRRLCEHLAGKGFAAPRLRVLSGAVLSMGGVLLVMLSLAS